MAGLWGAATEEERRQIARALFEAIWCDPVAKVITRWEVRPAFRPFFETSAKPVAGSALTVDPGQL